MLAQVVPFDYEVVVVDYGCPDATYSWCVENDWQRLRTIRVLDDTMPFNLSRARNIGATYSSSSILAFVDADVRLASTWLADAAVAILSGDVGLTLVDATRGRGDRRGTCCVAGSLFHRVRGYDEAMRGWGFEDRDFYGRCCACAGSGTFDGELVQPIKHADAERLRFYEFASKRTSRALNRRRASNRGATINPEGYGRATVEVYCNNQKRPRILSTDVSRGTSGS